MISGIRGSAPVLTPNISRLKGGRGKLAIPVRPFQAYYAHFKYLTGVPSPQLESSVSLSKLRVLDKLIDRLVGQKGKAAQYLKISKNNIDQLISKLNSELKIKENFQKHKYESLQPEKGIMLNMLI